MLVRLDLLQNANGSGYLITSDSSGSLYFLEAPSSDGFLKFTSSSRQIEWGNPSTDFYIGSAPPAGSSHLAAANLNMENFNISGVNTLTTVQLNYSSQFTDLLSWNIYQNSGSGHLAFKYSGAEQFNIGRNGSVTSSLFTGRTEKINVTSSVYVTGSLQIKGSGSSIFSVVNELEDSILSIGESTSGNYADVEDASGNVIFSVSEVGSYVSKSLSLSGSLVVNHSQIDFNLLPTTDPGIAGRLFITSSDSIGGSSGLNIVVVSQG